MIRDDSRNEANLINALSVQFSEQEAEALAVLLLRSCQSDSITYEEIKIDPELKDDIIMLAFEERVLLPMKSRRGSAWEDRILGFAENERYHIPRIVRFLVKNAQETGRWEIRHALEQSLEEAGETNVNGTISYLQTLIDRSPRFELEVGIMQTIGTELKLEIDMHDTLDRFVRCGIISPRTQRSLHTGFSKYELNPCLYWKM